ncbi:hypothetical protein HLH34_00700 [Gluconacetobacter azotocaptans]|uniref:Uncharacterized protein n=1 Tax=Gluconacetobacter azotocaptans TaxID=142834 RepID=A0A7W4JPM3_9PROT|nr:hypothetical protein [Gluconacetobacter azotocaptans]MBB2188482.1 hypothetical protein [Gluconacetobacter azotocaptans]MBM9400187.1 hypothetical protein [Gluconacetobacter azotocaptans]
MLGFVKPSGPPGWKNRGNLSYWDEIGLVVLIVLVVAWAILVAITA